MILRLRLRGTSTQTSKNNSRFSAATLPVTFQAVEKLGVDSRIARFVLPLGTGLNTDGTALFMAISTIFITQMNGMTLEFGELVTVMITVSLLCMCGASIPSGSLLLILIVLQAIGCPAEDVTLLFVIDWLLYVISISILFPSHGHYIFSFCTF